MAARTTDGNILSSRRNPPALQARAHAQAAKSENRNLPESAPPDRFRFSLFAARACAPNVSRLAGYDGRFIPLLIFFSNLTLTLHRFHCAMRKANEINLCALF